MSRRNLNYRRGLMPYIFMAVFLMLLGICFPIARYGHLFGVTLPTGIFATIIIWIFSVSLVLTGLWLILFARSKYLRQRQLARRRAAVRAAAARSRKLESGFYITAVGGGTGLSTILKGLKEISSHISAIVTVTDNGGSSGRLLEGNTVVPPGDIRNCLVALSPREGILEDMFHYRFEQPEELRGHSLGNLMIAGLADFTGDMAKAIRDIGRILNIRGNVIPVTLDDVTLGAVMNDGEELLGETTIVKDRRSIREVFLQPRNAEVNIDAVDAIIAADIILLGPGSLYTSIIPNLLVPGILEALQQTKAPVWYVANIMTQRGETEGYDLSDHIEAIVSLSEEPFLTGVVVNTAKVDDFSVETYRKGGLSQVENDMKAIRKYDLRVVGLPLAKKDGFIQHDAEMLAKFVASGKF